jgi:hypothetical protein
LPGWQVPVIDRALTGLVTVVKRAGWLASLVVVGCADSDLVACTEEARPGLVVTVRDSVVGAAVYQNVRVVARNGVYADTATESLLQSGIYSLAYERAGTYTVSVEHPSYAVWQRSGVTVTADQCHVETVALLARLQLLPR